MTPATVTNRQSFKCVDNTVVDTFEFDSSQGSNPFVVSLGGNLFGIAYQGPNDDGFFSTVQVDESGQIGSTVLDTLEFDSTRGAEPSLISVGPNIFAIAYRGRNNDGRIVTISLQ